MFQDETAARFMHACLVVATNPIGFDWATAIT
jgi:hypothetical protein